MNLRKLMVGTLAVTMVLGSSMTVFAEEQTGNATGTGTSVGHLDKEVLTVTLPTGTDNTFDYYVDPERVIDLAGHLTDNTAVTKNADGVWEKVPYYTIDDKLPYGHGEKSVYIISGFMRLSREEAFAIRYHMGFSGNEDRNSIGNAFEMFPLAFALSVADMEATYFLEGKPRT